MVTELRRHEDLERLLEHSRSNPILIFKHSTQCSISAAAYEEFLKFTGEAADVACGLVLVIENRALSNAIEAEFGIRHESPQAILIENGQPKWNASHWSITSEALAKATRG
jgi:bacillithiol system protein YtxJ